MNNIQSFMSFGIVLQVPCYIFGFRSAAGKSFMVESGSILEKSFATWLDSKKVLFWKVLLK